MTISPELARLSRTIEPGVLGERIKTARTAAHLTQGALAGDDASTAYVSRIEAGQRRPDLKLLVTFADRLGVTLDQLLIGISPAVHDEVRLELDYAELALRSGRAGEAFEQISGVLERTDAASLPGLKKEALLIEAQALESLGHLDDAIMRLEDLIGDEEFGSVSGRASIALTRCYREAGDLGRSIERGEALLAQFASRGLDGTTEAVQLAVTVAAAHFERGDVGHAVRLCRRAIARAEETGSPRAMASAYWNASIMESEQGRVAAAIPLAEQALALLARDEDNRGVARLRAQLGMFLLDLDPPEVEAARHTLEAATKELEWSSASLAERTNNQLSLARAMFLSDDIEEAGEILRRSASLGEEATPMVIADTHVLLGQIEARNHNMEAAQEHYQAAAQVLTGTGADRRAAQLWFELGSLFEETGDHSAAGDAFRRAAVSTGLVSTRAKIHLR